MKLKPAVVSDHVTALYLKTLITRNPTTNDNVKVHFNIMTGCGCMQGVKCLTFRNSLLPTLENAISTPEHAGRSI